MLNLMEESSTTEVRVEPGREDVREQDYSRISVLHGEQWDGRGQLVFMTHAKNYTKEVER